MTEVIILAQTQETGDLVLGWHVPERTPPLTVQLTRTLSAESGVWAEEAEASATVATTKADEAEASALSATASALSATASASSAVTKAGEAAASAALAAAAASKSANTLALIASLRANGRTTSPLVRIAAGDTPTLTLGTNGAASTINGNLWYAPTVNFRSALLTYLCGPIVDAGTGYPTNNYMRARGPSYGGTSRGIGSLIAYEFMHTGTQFEIPVFGQGSSGTNVRVLVGGVMAGSASVPNSSGQAYYLKVVFPGSATRHITIETQGVPCNGVNVASSGEIASTAATRPTATVIGDSFPEGTGAELGESEGVVMCRALGLDCALAGSGGTGMINPGTHVSFTEATRLVDLTLAGVTSTQTGAATADPKLGIVFGSMNDHGVSYAQYSPYGATLQAAIANRTHAMIDAWATARPGKPIVFFGPTWPRGQPNDRPVLTVYNVRDGIMEACWNRAKDNVWYIDRLMPALREGLYSNAGDMASLYTGGDSTHPTALGHKFDGMWYAQQVRSLILGEFG